MGKCCQKISTSVGFSKKGPLVVKCCQNCANLLCRNIISRASPENKKGKKENCLLPKIQAGFVVLLDIVRHLFLGSIYTVQLLQPCLIMSTQC